MINAVIVQENKKKIFINVNKGLKKKKKMYTVYFCQTELLETEVFWQIAYLRKTELFEIELFWYLTVCEWKLSLY